MYNLLIRAILIVALGQFGMSLLDLGQCRDKGCLKQIEQRSRDVLKIDWKPISLFPEEAKRFR